MTAESPIILSSTVPAAPPQALRFALSKIHLQERPLNRRSLRFASVGMTKGESSR
jgi:hypothetical protein